MSGAVKDLKRARRFWQYHGGHDSVDTWTPPLHAVSQQPISALAHPSACVHPSLPQPELDCASPSKSKFCSNRLSTATMPVRNSVTTPVAVHVPQLQWHPQGSQGPDKALDIWAGRFRPPWGGKGVLNAFACHTCHPCRTVAC